jgi:hypothetical protein
MTIGLIVNPHSGKVNRKGLELARLLAGKPGINIRLLSDFRRLADELRDLASLGVTDLYLSSGDGTIQEVQTRLAEDRIFASLPRLCLLPHGTTNMTAADVGLRLTRITEQAEFMQHAVPAHLVTRPTLRVANPADGIARHGMFLGAGAVTQATRYCQQAVHRSGLKGDFATFATLALAIARAMVSRADPADPSRIDRPHDIHVLADGSERAAGSYLLLLATTLDRLILGTRPFWGSKTAPLRISLFPYPLPSIARWLLPSMYGGEDRTPPPGVRSFSCSQCQIRTASGFVIDGEFFAAPASAPLLVETGPEITYIRG